jgi:hypothetical protein
MKVFIRTLTTIGKSVFICGGIIFILVMGFSPKLQVKAQCFDLKSAVIISVGFGLSIQLFINNRKKV